MENGTKLRILYLYQHLVQHTDAEHTLSTAELMKILKEDYSVKVSRNTISDDLSMLHDCGLHIEHYESTQNKYYYDGHIYELPELKILVDATLVRDLLRRGEMEEAARFLGHPHCLSGLVVSGKRLGRTMGIPTVNIAVTPEVLVLPAGVYAARVAFGGQDYAAVTNVGTCPTVSDHAPLVEPWILDFSDDLYGHEIRIFFHRKLRGEQKFPSLAALQAEIRRNADETLAYFAK